MASTENGPQRTPETAKPPTISYDFIPFLQRPQDDLLDLLGFDVKVVRPLDNTAGVPAYAKRLATFFTWLEGVGADLGGGMPVASRFNRELALTVLSPRAPGV